MRFNPIHPSIVELYINTLTLHLLQERLGMVGPDATEQEAPGIITTGGGGGGVPVPVPTPPSIGSFPPLPHPASRTLNSSAVHHVRRPE